MKRIHSILAGGAATIGLAVMTAVVAAPGGTSPGGGYGPGYGPGYGMGPGMGWGMGPGMMHGGFRGMGPGGLSAEALGQMKAQLAITPAQEAAWKAFADQAAAQAAAMQATHLQHHQAAADPATAPERMGQHLDAMTQHLAGMQQVRAALDGLYAVLTPEQRATADQQFGFMGRGGAGPGWRR